MIYLGFGVVCGGLWCGLWCFVVVCGVLWWFVVFSATPQTSCNGNLVPLQLINLSI